MAHYSLYLWRRNSVYHQLTSFTVKKIIPALLFVLLVSCTKEPLTAPNTGNQNLAANTVVTYKDSSISVVNFKAQPNSDNIKVTFTTLYQKDVVKLEVLKGVTANNLCSIYNQPVNADSYSATEYSTSDTNENNVSKIFYMIKYTLANGDWGYTPVFELSL